MPRKFVLHNERQLLEVCAMARFLLAMLLVVFLGPLVIPLAAAGLALVFALGAVLLAVGIVCAVVGVVVALIALPFKLAFGFFCA